MKNILSIGEVLMDVYYEEQISEIVGGASFNVSCSIGAIKNNNSYFVGALGNDKYKNEIQKFFKKYNVKDKLVQNSNVPTTIAQVTLDENKERYFKFIRNSDAEYKLNTNEIEKLLNVDFIHFGSATAFLGGNLKKSYEKLFKYAINNKIKFSFDPNFRDKLWITDKEIKEFVEYCKPFIETAHLIKLSDDELRLLTDIDNQIEAVSSIASKNPKALIAVSRGSDDTLFVWKNVISYVPVASSKKLRDTTGAGDSFISKLIDEYVTNKINDQTSIDEITRIVHNANLFASKSVEHLGALTFLDFI
ncbi:fructokinase [Entomoplasma ellychniae]|uniref:Fructokinase n=1 Tax=Entomoplasma ellychniae TaxID=2114 RepID=A0A8E2QVD5_9MOLU|nr:carbohydrate kinase [Entomoplasma ellychniae]PPE04376.1 fructokinase [Entomoplasma ellychniae]